MLKRVLLGLLLVAVGFAGGAVFGYRVIAKPFMWLGSLGRSFTVSQYAITQSKEAAYPEARQALEAYIRYLNHSTPVADPCLGGESPWFDARGLRFDKTFAWVRLAMLHESNGNISAADAAWREADALAAQGTWKDRSHQHFRDLVTSMDRVHPTPVAKSAEKSGGAFYDAPAVKPSDRS
jgi:hypothetical protein